MACILYHKVKNGISAVVKAFDQIVPALRWFAHCKHYIGYYFSVSTNLFHITYTYKHVDWDLFNTKHAYLLQTTHSNDNQELLSRASNLI